MIGAATTAIAAIAAVFFTSMQSNDELGVTREGQITDRYTAAVSNLGDQSTEVRLGGIYALQRIMKGSPRDQPSIVDVLSAYIRTHARASGTKNSAFDRRPEADVQAAFEVLARRFPAHDATAKVDLRETYLPWIGLLRGGSPDSAYAGTDYPRLPDANLSGAILRNATMPHADLRGAYLVGANLDHVRLQHAQLRGASPINVSLHYASLRGADLRYADLRGADLTGADLTGADLRGAILRAGQVGKVNGREVTLKPTQATVQQLISARLDSRTKLPAGLGNDPKVRKQIAKDSARKS